jgi:diguanylate cyclase (GGDEF)-like protein
VPTDSGSDRPTQFEILSAGIAAVGRGATLDVALEGLLGGTAELAGSPAGAIFLQDPDRPDLELVAIVGLDGAGRDALLAAVGGGEHPVAIAARTRAGASGPEGTAWPLLVGRDGIEDGLGALWLAAPVSPSGFGFVAAVADLIALAADRARLQSSVGERAEWYERLAHTDPLTGLANARTFARVLELELARAGRQGSEVSIALFDIDDFAATNEIGGRPAGDEVLRSVAAIVAGSVRLVDTVARYGADEFVLVAPGSAGLTVARRIIYGIDALPEVAGRRISVSAGVVTFPGDGTDAETLLAAAEAAVGRARTEGRGNVGTPSA